MITGVTPGRVTLTVHISGYAPELKLIEVTSGETTKIDVKLRQAMTLSGLVVDQDNKPIPGAYIETTLWRGRNTLDLRTITNMQGQFSLENTPPDEFEISVRAAEFSRIKRMVKAGNAEPITLHLKRISPQGRGTSADVAHINDPAPSFDLTSMDGKSLKLGELKGKTILLDFWATWCGPCMAAMPQLQKVHESFEGKPVVVIGVNQQEDRTDVEEVVAEKGFQFTQLLDADSTVGDAFLVSGIPQTVVIDTEGVVQAVHVGYSPGIKSLLSGQIDRLLNGEDIFDPVKVAAARQRRKERREKLLAQLGPMNPERLTRLGEVLVDSSVSISNNYRPALWTKFPHLPGDTLTLMAGSRRLLMVRSNLAQTGVGKYVLPPKSPR
ncbi:MAG: redoxin family protein [Planctomycetes bacterium]|nr:redoxin family protein [Planctomycetota bacterium]